MLRLDSIERAGKEYYSGTHMSCKPITSGLEEYKVSGSKETPEDPKLEFWIHLMDLSSEDKHNIQSNPKHIPCPTVNSKLSSRFYLPIGLDIAYESGFMASVAPRLTAPF